MLTDPLLRGAMDERMIAAMRLVLAASGLLVIYIQRAGKRLRSIQVPTFQICE